MCLFSTQIVTANERRTASVTTGTMTLNRSPGMPVTTGTPEMLVTDGTLVTEEGNQLEILVIAGM